MRPKGMRILLPLLIAALAPQLALAAPADLLAEARSEMSAGHVYSADALLQQVVESSDANSAQVEEALLIQCLIYSGDVLGAAALIGPLASASPEGSGLKTLVSQQLLLARRAFSVAANSYLNTTIKGTSLNTVTIPLPAMTQDDVDALLATLADDKLLTEMMEQFENDPSAGHGLLAKVNIYSLYLAAGAAFPLGSNPKVGQIGPALRGGMSFDQLYMLDWAACTALDMSRMVNEPSGPDMANLASRFDQRIITLAGSDPQNKFVVLARERAKLYGP